MRDGAAQKAEDGSAGLGDLRLARATVASVYIGRYLLHMEPAILCGHAGQQAEHARDQGDRGAAGNSIPVVGYHRHLCHRQCFAAAAGPLLSRRRSYDNGMPARRRWRTTTVARTSVTEERLLGARQNLARMPSPSRNEHVNDAPPHVQIATCSLTQAI